VQAPGRSARRTARIPPRADWQHGPGRPGDGELRAGGARPADVAARAAACVLWPGQLVAVHRDEHGNAVRARWRPPSSGNSLLSMVMMLASSLGVATAGGLLAAFTGATAGAHDASVLPAFHATFLCVGFVTTLSAWIFWQLAPVRASVPVESGEAV